jgi:hypothetical protein
MAADLNRSDFENHLSKKRKSFTDVTTRETASGQDVKMGLFSRLSGFFFGFSPVEKTVLQSPTVRKRRHSSISRNSPKKPRLEYPKSTTTADDADDLHESIETPQSSSSFRYDSEEELVGWGRVEVSVEKDFSVDGDNDPPVEAVEDDLEEWDGDASHYLDNIDNSAVMDEMEYAKTFLEVEDEFDPVADKLAREQAARDLLEQGWSESAVALYSKMDALGKQPLLPCSWKLDYPTIPDALFSVHDEEVFIKSVRDKEFRGKISLFVN